MPTVLQDNLQFTEEKLLEADLAAKSAPRGRTADMYSGSSPVADDNRDRENAAGGDTEQLTDVAAVISPQIAKRQKLAARQEKADRLDRNLDAKSEFEARQQASATPIENLAVTGGQLAAIPAESFAETAAKAETCREPQWLSEAAELWESGKFEEAEQLIRQRAKTMDHEELIKRFREHYSLPSAKTITPADLNLRISSECAAAETE